MGVTIVFCSELMDTDEPQIISPDLDGWLATCQWEWGRNSNSIVVEGDRSGYILAACNCRNYGQLPPGQWHLGVRGGESHARCLWCSASSARASANARRTTPAAAASQRNTQHTNET